MGCGSWLDLSQASWNSHCCCWCCCSLIINNNLTLIYDQLNKKLSEITAPSTGVSISTDSRQNVSATLHIEVGYFFLERRGTSLNNVITKKYIIKSVNENVVMMCFHWFYSYVLVIWTQYFSQFFTSFFKGLRRICSRAKVGNLVFIICSLPVGTDCVTDKSKGIEWKLHFLEWKTRSFVVNLFCTTLKTAFWSFQISNFSGEAWPQTTSPPPYCQLLYSNLLASSIFTKNPYINL